MRLFVDKTLNDITNSLSIFNPQGKAVLTKDDSEAIYHKFLRGLSGEAKRVYDAMNDLSEDYDITRTTELITFWESAVGIPDGCFPGTGSLEERRIHVLVKFAQMNVQTADDFIELGETLGFPGLMVQALQDTVFPPYDVPFTPTSSPNSRYVILVTGTNVIPNVPPYDVPFTPSSQTSSFLECVFNLVRPANTKIVFSNV